MKKFLITVLAAILLSIGTNASNHVNAARSTRSFYVDYVMRSCMKKLQKVFTVHLFYSHYDAGSGYTWILYGNDNASTGMTITGASNGSSYASWIENPNIVNHGTFTNEWYWIDATTVHATCKVHYNASDDGYFIVDDDMTI